MLYFGSLRRLYDMKLAHVLHKICRNEINQTATRGVHHHSQFTPLTQGGSVNRPTPYANRQPL